MKSIEDCIHPEGAGMKLVNVKFFRGDNHSITPEEFRAKLCAAAEFQRANPAARLSEAPRTKKPKINVRDRVANL